MGGDSIKCFYYGKDGDMKKKIIVFGKGNKRGIIKTIKFKKNDKNIITSASKSDEVLVPLNECLCVSNKEVEWFVNITTSYHTSLTWSFSLIIT